MQLTVGQQARRLKQFSEKEELSVAGIDQMLESLKRLETENNELRELVQTL